MKNIFLILLVLIFANGCSSVSKQKVPLLGMFDRTAVPTTDTVMFMFDRTAVPTTDAVWIKTEPTDNAHLAKYTYENCQVFVHNDNLGLTAEVSIKTREVFGLITFQLVVKQKGDGTRPLITKKTTIRNRQGTRTIWTRNDLFREYCLPAARNLPEEVKKIFGFYYRTKVRM